MQPRSFISCSPEKSGAVFALFYLESHSDVLGWHLETRPPYFSAAFFMIENYYAEAQPHLYRSIEDDVYGAWTIDHPPIRNRIRCPLPDAIAHELERQQSAFVEDWLFFSDDTRIGEELAQYEAHGLPVHEANLRWRRLQRLQENGDIRIHSSTGTDLNLVQFLRRYWRLNEKVPG